MTIQNTIQIDSTIVLRMVEAQLALVTSATIEYLGMPPAGAGETAKPLRVKSLDLQYANRSQNATDTDEAELTMELGAMVATDGTGGALLNLSAVLTAVKVAFDRQYMDDSTTAHQLRTQVTSTSIVDTAQPGSENSNHGALIGSVSIRGTVTRTSTLGIIDPG